MPPTVVEGGQQVVRGAIQAGGVKKVQENFQEDKGCQNSAGHGQQFQGQQVQAA
jgi:hypothetical protein